MDWKPATTYTFTMSDGKDLTTVTIGDDPVLCQILEKFRGFLYASGFNYISSLDAMKTDGDVISSEDAPC